MFIRSRSQSKAFAAGFIVASAALLFVAGCGGSSSSSPGRAEKIVFVSEDDGFSGINTINPDGTGRKLLFPEGASEATFSPDGLKIVFLSVQANCGGVGCHAEDPGPVSPSQIWMINADGTGIRQLTRSTTGIQDLMFSPDGSRVLYTTFENADVVLHTMNLDGSNDSVLLRRQAISGLSLSPDGTKFLFTKGNIGGSNDNTAGIYTMKVDGSGETRLTNGPLIDNSCTFSPDGSRILFSRSGGSGQNSQTGLWIMNADGSGQTQLTNAVTTIGSLADYQATFSPDGKQIVFTSSRGIGGNVADASPSRVFVMNTDGANQHPIPERSNVSPYSVLFDKVASHNAWARTTVP